jgi:hypothetical protein
LKSFEHSIAKVIRIEKEISTGTLYLVFEVTDESFKKDIEKNWLSDIDLKLIGKELVKKTEE